MVAVPSADQDQPLQPPEPAVAAAVTLQHRWTDRSPRVLYGKSLRICYRLLADGVVTRQLVGIDDPSGTPIAAPRHTFPGLDWSEQQERGGVAGKGRPVVLQFDQDEAEAALMTWLESVGLYAPGDA